MCPSYIYDARFLNVNYRIQSENYLRPSHTLTVSAPSGVPFIKSPQAQKLYCVEILHPLGHVLTVAMFRDTIYETSCTAQPKIVICIIL